MVVRMERWPWCPGYSFKACKTDKFGRFGGGFNYALGVEIGGGTIIINLLLGLIRIDFKR